MTHTMNSGWFRLFVGDLSNDVSDEVLSQAFVKYKTFTKARVIRDKLSQKVHFIMLCCVTLLLTAHNCRPSTGLWRSLTQKTFSKPGRKWTVSARTSHFDRNLTCVWRAGKYVGNRPIRLKKAETPVRAVDIGHKKAKQLDHDRKHRPKPF